jgi:uncharacterized membrane protein
VEADRPDRMTGGPPAGHRVAGAMTVGLVAGAVVAVAFGNWSVAPVAGWDVAAVAYAVPVWMTIWGLEAERTSRLATREDPTGPVAHLLLVAASVASLGAVALVLVEAGNRQGAAQGLLLALGLVSVVCSWTVVHTVYTLHYARLYYTEPVGGVDFNEEARPRYSDFAYLAFTIGMTFQVSDTAISSALIRRTALRHALLSYLFGTGVLATTINLVASLSSR